MIRFVGLIINKNRGRKWILYFLFSTYYICFVCDIILIKKNVKIVIKNVVIVVNIYNYNDK